MNEDAIISKNRKKSFSKMTILGDERENSKVIVSQGTPPHMNATIELSRSKRRISLTKATIIKREEDPLQSKKRKEKVIDTHVSKKKSSSNRRLSRRNFTMSKQYEGSRIDFEKIDQLGTKDFKGSQEKQSKKAICNPESQWKTITKPRNLKKPKNRFLLQLTKIREENSCPTPSKQKISQGVYSTIICQNEKDKSNLQDKDLIHSKGNSSFESLTSQHVKSRTKKKINKNRKNINALDEMVIQKSSLKEKQKNGSHGLHALRNPIVPRKMNNKFIDGAQVIETTNGKEQTQGIQSSNKILDINSSDHTKKGFQSKATAIALKLANDTLGFVRTTLKAVEDSKNNNLKVKERVSKRRKEDDGVDNNPNGILTTVATRYKSTLESLQSNKILTTEKLIEELGAIRLASKGNAAKTRKLGKRHGARPIRSTLKKNSKDGPIPRGNLNENEIAQADVIDDRKDDVKHVKLGRKTKRNIEKQMKEYGLVDTAPQIQGFITSVARDVETKKSKSPMASGFDRLISGANGNKELESCLAQIVSSHDAELAWTEDQEKALQNAYLSIKQTDGDFWHLISEEVPGRSAKECYDRFYSRHPTPSAEPQALATRTQPNEVECSPPLSKSPNTKSKVTSLKVTRKQNQLETQKTIRNILGNVDSTNSYKTRNKPMENNHLNTMQDLGSVLDRGEDEKAVILQYSNTIKDYNSTAPLSHVEEDMHTNHGKDIFENVVITGVRTPSDKENDQPLNIGQEAHPQKLGVPRVELILKQVDNGECLPYDSRPKTTSTNTNRKKKIIKTNNVYLHSKEALDFGDTTLDAIQLAKQELRNVFSRTRSRGGNYFDMIEVDQI